MRQSLSICTFNYPMLYPWINLELSNSKEALYDQRKFFSFLHQDRSPTSERKESYFLLVLTLRSQAPFLLLLAGALLLTPDNGAPGLRWALSGTGSAGPARPQLLLWCSALLKLYDKEVWSQHFGNQLCTWVCTPVDGQWEQRPDWGSILKKKKIFFF